MNRRNFIKETATIISAGSLLQQCTLTNKQTITGNIVGANSTVGHLLRTAGWQDADEHIHTGTVIIGGGVSGLSAARYLHRHNNDDFILLELDKETGGNATSGKNEVSAYPWGAHYIPIPNNDFVAFNIFLQECNVITGYNAGGKPFINDYYLCFEPQERLYLNGHWQDGLVPDFGVPAKEREEIKRFFVLINAMRLAKGIDGKDAFAIPVDNSSKEEQFLKLDTISMHEWLEENNFTSPYLHWYINYCCRDDFGTDYHHASAWAGIHYFAGRKGTAANAPPQSVITWPEGNAWLAKQLKKDFQENILTDSIAIKIKIEPDEVQVCMLNTINKKPVIVHAKHCIVATPQFVAARLLDYTEDKKSIIKKNFTYQPWMVANITTNKLKERNGAELSWDNVLYQSTALGYVEATHQHINQLQERKVLTYYLPLTEKDAAAERDLAYKRSYKDWVDIILKDLTPVHEDLLENIISIDVWVWGHAMISPQKGFIHGAVKKQLQEPIDNKVFFAHTDLSGISIFEEAFHQGIKAAEQIVKLKQP